jgi:hypothetical protein
VLIKLETGGLHGATKGLMKTGRDFAWVTQTDAVQSIRATVGMDGRLPAVIRDKLGLRHYNDDQKLVEIVYSEDCFAASALAPPTFVEGSPNLIYRSTKRKDGWGRAVDLSTCEDGLPEAVHRPIPFTSDFRIRLIGRIAERNESIDFDALYKNHPTPWHEADLARINKLVGR